MKLRVLRALRGDSFSLPNRGHNEKGRFTIRNVLEKKYANPKPSGSSRSGSLLFKNELFGIFGIDDDPDRGTTAFEFFL